MVKLRAIAARLAAALALGAAVLQTGPVASDVPPGFVSSDERRDFTIREAAIP